MCLAVAAAWGAAAPQPSPDQVAKTLLEAGRQAFAEGKLDVAAERFREFLQNYGEHRDAAAAGYGLALTLREAAQPDPKAIQEALRRAIAREDFPDRPAALYYFAESQRAMGDDFLAQAAGKPNEAKALQSAARQAYAEAVQRFAAAAKAFEAAKPAPSTAPATAPAGPAKELEWAARARCDQCESLLRMEGFAEAEKLAAAILADPQASKGPYRELALYHLGYANFGQGKNLEAGKALSQLAPFGQAFGLHARYLLGRLHQSAAERPEAAAQYQAVLAGFDAERKQAAETLKNPQGLTPRQRAALDAAAQGSSPEYVGRALFYAAQLQAEEGRFADALKGFADLARQQPNSLLAAEAQLRVGYCQLQLKAYAEVPKALQPLHGHPQLADQALWWTARAQADGADPKNAPAYQQTLVAAIDIFRQAADRSAQLAGKGDPAARSRRGDILMDLADTQQLAGHHKEAAATYAQVAAERPDAPRAEEAIQRQATVLHMAGLYDESDAACRRFEQVHPRSTLLPAVLFRGAENAYFRALAAEKDPKSRSAGQLDRLYAEGIRRYDRLIQYSPDFQYANLARQGMAMLHYRQGRYAEAAAILAGIADPDRTGDLVTVSYLQADCILRALPPDGDDAVSAARLVAQLDKASKLLEAFIAAAGKAEEVPEAILKLGQCYQRIAGIITDGNERSRLMQQARQGYERVQREFPGHPMASLAILQRAQCLAVMGDPSTAANELRRFLADPLKSSPAAPLAIARMCRLMRAAGRAAESLKVLTAYRAEKEQAILEDPQRRPWAAMLQYEHALALIETGKPAEALPILDGLIQQFAGTAEARQAIGRRAQCRREELAAAVNEARRLIAQGARPEQIEAARQQAQQAQARLREALGAVHAEAEGLAGAAGGSTPHLQMLYELAWGYRALADTEIDAAREKLRREAMDKAREALSRIALAGESVPEPIIPQAPLAEVPVQPSEKTAQVQYERLIAAAPDDALAVRARYELAEMHLGRMDDPEHVKAATKLLGEALAKSPPKDLAEMIRLRLATCLLAAGDIPGATGHLRALGASAERPAHPYTPGYARYLAAEALIRQKNWAAAADQLAPFRDDGNLRSIPQVSERAVLRLGQAAIEAGQWDRAAQSFRAMVERYPYSPYAADAYYGMGWAFQNLKQYDQAIQAYAQVIRRTVAEAAAKAQFQIGVCRLEQGKPREAATALVAVPLTYGYAEWNAAAWCEAGRAYEALKETDEAAKLYRKVVTDHGASPWAETARKRLAALGKQST